MINYRVFFYLPNIVGYLRILLLAFALYSFGHSPFLTLFSYALSQVLDALDGHLARLFNQESAFGVFLDMITDRLSSTSLSSMLITLYPQHAFLLTLAIILDMGSHWAHMYTTLIMGETHHKKAIMYFAPLRLYYAKKYIMFPLILGYEGFLLVLYVRNFPEYFPMKLMEMSNYLMYIFGALFLYKQFINVCQFANSAVKLTSHVKIS